MSARQYVLATAAAIGAGVIYVLVHERRRKAKKEMQRKMEQPIPKEQLVEILQEASAEAVKFAEQIGVWVAKMQKEHSLTEERAHQLRQVRLAAERREARAVRAPCVGLTRRAALRRDTLPVCTAKIRGDAG